MSAKQSISWASSHLTIEGYCLGFFPYYSVSEYSGEIQSVSPWWEHYWGTAFKRDFLGTP